MFGTDDLSEEFKTKAATIFEAAVMSRVTAEVARLEEEFEAKVATTVAEEIEGIVEQVDGYLGYIAEQWMTQNEIALERGIKSDILESFVDGLKGLFEEHYIDVPEEKYDLLGEMETEISDLKSKIDEQVAANVELTKSVNEAKRNEIVKTVSEGLTDTEAEKFAGLVAEVAFDDAETYETKVKTLRESYFTTKTTSGVTSVVTDTPVEVITESGSKKVDPKMSAYLSALNNK
jgi:Fe2+ transport system protein B